MIEQTLDIDDFLMLAQDVAKRREGGKLTIGKHKDGQFYIEFDKYGLPFEHRVYGQKEDKK